MARPIKQGLDYFPLDTSMDSKTELFEAEHGIHGFGFLIKIYQKIYDNGYFYEWNEDEQLLFARRINVDKKVINAYINSAIKRNIFNKDIFEAYGILTSRGIQKRFLEACKRRKQIELIKEIVLIDFTNLNYTDFKNKIVYVSNNLINVDNNSQNVDNKKQIKEKKKEIKVNKRKLKYKRRRNKNNISKVIQSYQENITMITEHSAEILKDFTDEFGHELVILAIKKAVEGNVRTISYIKGILTNWRNTGIRTIADVENKNNKYAQSKKNKNQVSKAKFGQREYKEGDLDFLIANDLGVN